MQDALSMTSDRVYPWRLLLEEYSPVKEYIKGVENTIADTINRLEYNLDKKDRVSGHTSMFLSRRYIY